MRKTGIPAARAAARGSRMKRILLTALCLLALCVPVSAEVDPYYSGPVDTTTGEPPSAEAAAAEAAYVRINGTTAYDGQKRTFVYDVGRGNIEIHANVADGMIVNGPVSVSIDEGMDLLITQNGKMIDSPNPTNLTAPGSYTVGVAGADLTSNLFSFTIVGEQSNLAGGYVMPEGFYILEATFNEEEAFYERNYISMEEEGSYTVEYICPDTGLRYNLATTIDRTPPQLTLQGSIDEEGRYHSEVKLGGLQNGDSVYITRDGEAIANPDDWVLTDPGMYQVQVFDPAGNSVSAQFTILVYLNFNSLLFFALLILVIVAVLVYIYIKRKKLKIV